MAGDVERDGAETPREGAGTGDAAATDVASVDADVSSVADDGDGGAAPEDPLLDVRGLRAGYGELEVLHGVDCAVGDGEYVAVVGPNGAGKSTLMKAVFGLADRLGGTIRYDGEDVTGLRPDRVIRRGICYVPQTDNVFPSLSVEENLAMGAYVLDDVPDERFDRVYERFPVLAERRGQRAGSMSGGEQQMLAMGRALMLDPGLLMLDEPSAGLAPELVDDVFDRIDAINAAGTSVMLVEQNATEALRRCDRGYVLASGENRFVDAGEALLADEEVRREFLGGSG